MKKIFKILLNNKGFFWFIPLIAAALSRSDNETAKFASSAMSFINSNSGKITK